MKEKIKFILGAIIVIVLVALIGIVIYNGVKSINSETTNPVATFEIGDYGNVKIELYPEYAPNTVSNFIALIEAGYYNNKVISGKDDVCVYMARSSEEENTKPTRSLIDSSIEENSDDDYEYEINGEFIANKFEANTLRHEKGIVSLNRSDYTAYGLVDESYNSGSAQFSIMMEDTSNLNGVYCAFGKVIEGFEVIEKIYNEAPIKQSESEEGEEQDESAIKEFEPMPVITNATVEKNGVDYKKPEVHKAFDFQSYINELYSSYYSE